MNKKKILALVEIRIDSDSMYCFTGNGKSDPCDFNGKIEYAQGNNMSDPPVTYFETRYCLLFDKQLKKDKDEKPLRCPQCLAKD